MTEEKKVRVLGLDIGTSFLASVEKSEEPNKVKLRKVRDAFLRIDPSEFMGGHDTQFGEKMLKKTGTHFIKINDTLFLLGDSAYQISLETNRKLLRPMSKGVLNPNEPVSAVMMEELIKALIGKPETDNDIVVYSIPAMPFDADYDIVYHEKTVGDIIRNIGYKNVKSVNEALAVTFSELYEHNFTGISSSWGGGNCNISYANRGIEILSYAVSKGGDYIDESAARQVNDTVSVLTYRKEQGMDIRDPKDEYEKAIAIYYKNLMEYVVKSFVHIYKSRDKKTLPRLFTPIPFVIAGGTSLVGGFVETFKEILDKEKDFPIKISEVIPSSEKLYSVSNGCYNVGRLSVDD